MWRPFSQIIDNSAGSGTYSGGSKQSSEKAAPREGSSSSYDTLNSGGESGEGEGDGSSSTPTPQNSKDDREYARFDQDIRKDKYELKENPKKGYLINSSIRDAVSLGRTSSTPPPLCSLCQHKTPVFGKPPKQFSYKELEDATDAFSDINFLSGGGFGVVHMGVLRDGQVVAVKQLKFGGSQADADFCREV
ncbi:hypothetical protein FF2_016095 [Malus domestica]